MKAKKSFLLFALLVLAVGVSLLYAGTTGKITGRITDAATGEPLVGATIVIKGTTMGAAADIAGNYVILGVPPGAYTVAVSMVGYQRAEFVAAEQVKLRIGSTAFQPLILTMLRWV
jgi:hypothetical protein